MSSINNLTSSAVELVENPYISAWKSAPVKMALGHVTVGAAVAGAIYYREDIAYLAKEGIQNAKFGMDLAKSKAGILASDFASFASTSLQGAKVMGQKAIENPGKFAKDSLFSMQNKTIECAVKATQYADTLLTTVQEFASQKAADASKVAQNISQSIDGNVAKFKTLINSPKPTKEELLSSLKKTATDSLSSFQNKTAEGITKAAEFAKSSFKSFETKASKKANEAIAATPKALEPVVNKFNAAFEKIRNYTLTNGLHF